MGAYLFSRAEVCTHCAALSDADRRFLNVFLKVVLRRFSKKKKAGSLLPFITIITKLPVLFLTYP